jgi:hypothetical protein
MWQVCNSLPKTRGSIAALKFNNDRKRGWFRAPTAFVVLSAPAIDLGWRAPPFHPPSASDDLRSFTVARSALREVRALDHHVASDDRCRTSHASMRDP